MKIFIQKILFILVLASTTSLFCTQEFIKKTHEINQHSVTKPLKKIIIFTSKGGFWHMAACDALIHILSPYYDVSIVNPIENILHSYDFVKTISDGLIDGEQFYDWLLQNNWISVSNILYKYVVPNILQIATEPKVALVFDYLSKEKPDLVISVIPWLNLFISNAAHRLSVPFLLITPDSDLTTWWVLGLDKMTHDNFMVAIGVETKKTRPVLNACGIPNERIRDVGLLIRPDFLEKKDKEKIRATWDIPADKFVIMVMMGGAGSFASYKYAQKIASMNLNIHLLICIGKNEKLIEKISQIPLQKEVTLSCIPFTNKISDLMAVSDLLITKPGPGSVNEALYSELPMLIDKTGPCLFWENGNVDLVKENQWGDVVTSFDQLEEMIKKYMEKTYYERVKQALRSYDRKDFSKNIMQIITQLCPVED